MTQEEQRILIAETHGWQKRESFYVDCELLPESWFLHVGEQTIEDFCPPDYFNDTNAVIEACNAILTTKELKQAYARELARQVAGIHAFYGPTRDFSFPEVSAEDLLIIANATAAQRATALVAVIRKHIKPEV